jgi:hypothetical protein
MGKPRKEFKSEISNCCYVNKEKRFAIGFDNFQWILDYKNYNRYYGTIQQLLEALLELELRQYTDFKEKTVVGHLDSIRELIVSVSKGINLPNIKK